ncbi:MAG: DUF3179 domain-containing protein, partial [Acidimicrobiaceae bacterium]|nr:DUF3179 domain-containing protein [Acidimicrobiaceae bacterium]
MTSRARVLCGLLAALALVASACSSGSDTETTASTGDATAEIPEAAAPEASTSEGATPETAAPEAAAEDADTAADEPAADTAADESVADPALLEPRERGVLRNFLGYEFPPAPDVPTGPIDQAAVDILEVIWAGLQLGGFDGGLVAALGNTGDARLAWIMSDLLRFFYVGDIHDGAVSAFQRLTGVNLNDDPVSSRSRWQSVTDHLIAWDLPAFDRYDDYKGRLFTLVEPGWQPFFDDADATIDWRLLSWGGVLIDDRPLGDPNVCPNGCIPALDDPAVTDAAGGSWYSDDGIVFSVVINGEARAYPRHIMEIHEM